MENMMKGTKGTGKVILALLGVILMPILIWVALGVAISQKMRERAPKRKPAPTISEILATAGLSINGEAATGKMTATKVLMQQPAAELNRLLARAGLSIQEETIPKHCWEMLHCPPEKRETCPAYARRDVPSWVAIGLGKGGQVNEVCVNSTLLDLKTLPLKV